LPVAAVYDRRNASRIFDTLSALIERRYRILFRFKPLIGAIEHAKADSRPTRDHVPPRSISANASAHRSNGSTALTTGRIPRSTTKRVMAEKSAWRL
jgi:hypothetical protein